MKKIFQSIFILMFVVVLYGCGGGGSSSDASTPVASKKTEIEGTWVAATAGHTTGDACGLDVHGGYEVRLTFTFQDNSFQGKQENCAIVSGNTGVFVLGNTASGTFTVGQVYYTDPTGTYKTLDVVESGGTIYTGYALTGNTLLLAGIAGGFDGTSEAKRMNGTGTTSGGEFVKQ